MLIITIIAILLFITVIFDMGSLINPGVESYLDLFFYRGPFAQRQYMLDYIEENHIYGGLFGRLEVPYGDFWVFLNRWMMVVLILACIILAINKILDMAGKGRKYITDIPVYLGVIISFCLYYLAITKYAGYELVWTGRHLHNIVTVVFCITAVVVIVIWKIKSSKKKAETKEELSKKIPFAAHVTGVILVLAVPIFLYVGAISVCKAYEPYYGIYLQEDHSRLDLEEGFIGNFQNGAVETDRGIYYLDSLDPDEGYYRQAVRLLTPDGQIRDIMVPEGEDDTYDVKMYSLGFADGYLYICTENDDIIRMDPSNGSYDTVLQPQEGCHIADFCVLDNRLYYIERSDGENDPRIMYCDITDGELSEPSLYADDILETVSEEYRQYNDYARILNNYLTGDLYSGNLVNVNDYERYRPVVCNGGEYYINFESDFDEYNSRLVGRFPDGESFTRDSVPAFTIYNGYIYYVLLENDTVSIVKCSLDGSSEEVIASVDDGNLYGQNETFYFYNIMIGNGKIFVRGCGYIAQGDYYERTEGRLCDPGMFNFVTDLV